MARYDANGDGSIDESEWLRAKSDFIAEKITYSEMVEVYQDTWGSTDRTLRRLSRALAGAGGRLAGIADGDA